MLAAFNQRVPQMRRIVTTGLLVLAMTGCSPEVGSTAWCEAMDDKPKGDWTANEASEYAKNCIFRKTE